MATAMYPPPPYYRLYKDYSKNPNSAPEPPPPIEGTYVCFGGNYTTGDVLPRLEEKGVPQLYPKDSNVDGKKELLIISAYGYAKRNSGNTKQSKDQSANKTKSKSSGIKQALQSESLTKGGEIHWSQHNRAV